MFYFPTLNFFLSSFYPFNLLQTPMLPTFYNRMLGLLAYEFSMQPLLPYNVAAYTDFINDSWLDFISSDGSQLADFDVETGTYETD